MLRFKIVLVGDTGVGKTSLVRRYVWGVFSEELPRTVGVDFYVKDLKVDGRDVRLVIWDLAGQGRFTFVRYVFYRGAKGAMVVFDLSREETFKAVTSWVWEVRQHCGVIPILLIGNKLDLERRVKREEVEKMAKQLGVDGYAEVSAKTGQGVSEAFEELARLILAGALAS